MSDKPPDVRRTAALTAAGFLAALAVSGFLYAKSRTADYDRHASAVALIGEARRHVEALSEHVLAARFGLENHYDTVTETELLLSRDAAELRGKLGAVVEMDAALGAACDELARAVESERRAVERFKSENSVLRNSLYYLPTAGEEVTRAAARSPAEFPIVQAVNHVVQAALASDLVGDATARKALVEQIAELERLHAEAPHGLRQAIGVVLAHARVVEAKEPAVDAWLRPILETQLRDRLRDVEAAYDARFARLVESSNAYRRVLYGWSVALLVVVCAVGVQLRRLYLDLDRRVRLSTQELRAALDALWGEMKLARKIQEALVPTAPTLAGCDVAAVMRPAEEVGGDYYDVIRTPSAEWILIGDVSGHGVPAGLVMMMCQTAVRSMLEAKPEISPDELLLSLNEVLTHNIAELGDSRYMTLTALRRDKGGMLRFAGAHQDIHVYRARTNEVEVVETQGIWLGIRTGLEGAFEVRELRLDEGDVLVLHTDGVTEATRQGAMFDVAGLRAVVKQARGKTARALLDEIVGALEGFEIQDDVTVLVVRQLPAAL